MPQSRDNTQPQTTIAKSTTIPTRPRTYSTDSASNSIRSPRTARFAEATAVHSPLQPNSNSKLPFSSTTTTGERTPSAYYMAQPQPADVGFGYMNKHESVEMPKTPLPYGYETSIPPKSPMKSPLKSAMRTPGAPPRDFGGMGTAILSPQFQEEYLEKREKHTDKQQARDLKIKTRVRLAKILMRGVNFSCSLIVLAMLASVFNIFIATKDLPSRGSFSAWAPGQKIWPQVTLLVIAVISLVASVIVIIAYWKGNKKRAEKAQLYYTTFAVVFFTFSIVMWGIGAGILQGSKQNSGGKDMWSWSCVDNTRKELFQNDVNYNLICRLQNWSLICTIIEIVVEVLCITVYAIIFYRYWSKRKLRKSMANRDKVRSDLYLSQLRAQSAPNTPGLPPTTPRTARSFKPQPQDPFNQAPDMEEGNGGTQYVNADQKHQPAPFRLQAPPIKTGTPRAEQGGFSPVSPPQMPAAVQRSRTPSPPEDLSSPLMSQQYMHAQETQQEHFDAAPGEAVYDFVPPPGAYEYEVPQSPRLR